MPLLYTEMRNINYRCWIIGNDLNLRSLRQGLQPLAQLQDRQGAFEASGVKKMNRTVCNRTHAPQVTSDHVCVNAIGSHAWL